MMSAQLDLPKYRKEGRRDSYPEQCHILPTILRLHQRDHTPGTWQWP